jgi:hypothetical protein
MAGLELDAELGALPAMNWAQLKARWSSLTGRPVPRVKQMLLRQALAYELQASVYGGLSPRTERRLLVQANGGVDTSAAPGTKLVREWQGVLHTVTIAVDETIHWDGRTWNSLSEVARAITGTRWSGPAFFGLRQKARAA